MRKAARLGAEYGHRDMSSQSRTESNSELILQKAYSFFTAKETVRCHRKQCEYLRTSAACLKTLSFAFGYVNVLSQGHERTTGSLLLVMCPKRDKVATPSYTPPHVSCNRMATGEETGHPKMDVNPPSQQWGSSKT